MTAILVVVAIILLAALLVLSDLLNPEVKPAGKVMAVLSEGIPMVAAGVAIYFRNRALEKKAK